MTALIVIRCNPLASVQDAGRIGFRCFGVSTAGAMDRQSLALANALVGNQPDAAAIELPLSGAEFQVSGGSVLVSVCGPGTTLEISGRHVSGLTSALAVEGDRITVGPPRGGNYVYLAVAGGIQTIPELGSRSYHRRSEIGGDAMAPGSRLPCESQAASGPLWCYTGQDDPACDHIRFVPGPQYFFFPDDMQAQFQSTAFRVSPRSDRMGIRLEGPALHSEKSHDILSEGVVPGSVQVPGNGHPIVLGRDCQTTGGYPKIATVISADLDRLVQVPLGETINFRPVTLKAAIEAAHRAVFWRASLGNAMRPADEGPVDLLAHNLIGGVIRGDED